MPAKPSPATLARAVEDTESQAKARAAAPTWKEIADAFPGAKIVDHPDGTRSARVKGHGNLQKLEEMFKPKNRIEAENGFRRAARHKERILRYPDGSTRLVREEHVERAERGLGARLVRGSKLPGFSTWTDRQGRKWYKRPGEDEWRLLNG